MLEWIKANPGYVICICYFVFIITIAHMVTTSQRKKDNAKKPKNIRTH